MKKLKCTFKPGMVSMAIRQGPGTYTPIIGYVMAKTTPTFELDATVAHPYAWYPLIGGSGYVCAMSDYLYIETIDIKPPVQAPVNNNPVTPKKEPYVLSEGLDKNITATLKSGGKGKNHFDNMAKASKIFGSPFQFLEATDCRPTSDYDIGRTYLENILLEAPIVHFIPGRASYLANATDKQKDMFAEYIKSKDSGNGDAQKSIFGEELRYFDFVTDYADYINHVNLLCRVCAIYLGIEKKKVPGSGDSTYGNYDWARYLDDNKKSSPNKNGVFDQLGKAAEAAKTDLFGNNRFVQFYVDANSSFSESSGNSTQGSAVSNLFDSAEGIMKDIKFITASDGKDITNATGGITNAVGDALKKLTDWTSGSNSNISNIIGSATEVAEGNNVIFPEIWGDAAYNKSYDFTVNLMTPYGDIESFYINIIVPLMHILALGLPHQTSANGFTTPFLLKVFAKGWFSCEMGIIDSLRIEKCPSGDGWNVMGFPMEVRVTFSVKDLYENLMITKTSKPNLFFSNIGLMEYLAVTCGIDVTYPNILLKINTYLSVFKNTIFDIPSSIYKGIVDDLRNIIEPYLKIGR